MSMLAEHADHVIGVDTHRDAHAAAALATGTGPVTATTTIAADAFGYKRLLRFARRHARGRRVWAIESSGSFGAGLVTFLLAHREWVVEVDRPKRRARRNGAKSDELDAIRAAREALQRAHLAQPRARGDREAIRVRLITHRGAIRARTKAINHVQGTSSSPLAKSCDTSCATRRPTGSSIAARACAHCRRVAANTARPCSRCDTPHAASREIKRYVARQLFRLLEATAPDPTAIRRRLSCPR
jgi:hypothetical protein